MGSEITDPSARLKLARAAAKEQRYEEALSHYVWLYEHALKYDEAFYGVRLSYVLDEWRHVADELPTALSKMSTIRDEAAAKLASADASWDRFAELASLNKYLDDEAATHSIFVNLLRTNRELAISCLSIALPIIVRQKDAALAQELFPEVQSLALGAAEHLNEIQQYISDPEVLETMVGNSAQDIHDAESILRLSGRGNEAVILRRSAVAVVHSFELQEQLIQQLAKKDAPDSRGLTRRSSGLRPAAC